VNPLDFTAELGFTALRRTQGSAVNILRILVAVGVLALAGKANGQTLTNLYSFTGQADGGYPVSGLIQGSDGNFYGTTLEGGWRPSWGTVFRISPGGTLTTLYMFNGPYGDPSDGAFPNSGLVQGNDGNFYGTTFRGGTGPSAADDGCGIVFRVSPSGVETNLYSFPYYVNGGFPTAGLVQGYDGNFYGTTESGGAYAYSGGDFGTVFRISPSGVLTTLYSFSNSPSDGAVPSYSGLIQGSDSNFYGTTAGSLQPCIVLSLKPTGICPMADWFREPTAIFMGRQPGVERMAGTERSFGSVRAVTSPVSGHSV
jgi:uncharacterized repeat protein (TIGR03803 family)